MKILIPTSPGELIDKITILEIKKTKFTEEPTKLTNVVAELEELSSVVIPNSDHIKILRRQLSKINKHLWNIEDEIRACEDNQDFGSQFIHLARQVYQTNDERARVKRRINETLASDLIEEKS